MQYKNVALVIHPLQAYGGAEYNLRVFTEMFNEVTIYTAWYDKKLVETHLPGVEVKTSLLQLAPWKKRFQQELVPLLPLAYKSMKVSKKHDLVIVIADGFEKNIRFSKDITSVAYTLTPPRFLWLESRSTFQSTKWTYKIYDKYLYDFLHAMWKKSDLSSMKRYNHVISISEEVQKRVARIYDRDSHVVYPPVELDSIKYNRNGESRDGWFLYFGRIERYKGVELAIRAAVKGGYNLKIAGAGSQIDHMKDLVTELGGKHQVGFLGFVSERMKRELFFKCKALLYPVYDEDFGIVPVEANAAGAPVIAYKGGGVKESIIDGDTGLFFDEYSVDALLAKMEEIENMRFTAEKMKIQSMKFSRDAFQNKVKTFLNGISKR